MYSLNRAINFLHRQVHKIKPPPIESPYLYGTFGHAFQRILSEYASKSKVAIEFGVLNGYSTKIIATAMPPGGKLYSYDLFDRVGIEQVKAKVDGGHTDIHLERMNFDYWVTNPTYFDLLWIDIAATPEQMRRAHKHLSSAIWNGAIVLSEGTHRKDPERRIDVPHEDLCTLRPGLFRMLP